MMRSTILKRVISNINARNLSKIYNEIQRRCLFSHLGIKLYERHLKLAIALQSLRDQERAYSGLSHSHKSLGNLQEALVYSEKRLVVAHELGNEAKAAAFGDLGIKLVIIRSISL